MRDQGTYASAIFSFCVPAFAVFALAAAAAYFFNSVPRVRPPAVQPIRCAAISDDWPCGPDPAMQRAYPLPMRRAYPPQMQFDGPANSPIFSPSR
jgi:hypothetical protein